MENIFTKEELRLLCVAFDERKICVDGCLCKKLKSGYQYDDDCHNCSLKQVIVKLNDVLEEY